MRRSRPLILDDKKARRIARQLNLPVTGTLAILLKAKERGILPRVRDTLDLLIAANFRVSGQATAPTMTVNPLSVIAPGFLRKFFEFRRTIDEPGLPAAPSTRSER